MAVARRSGKTGRGANMRVGARQTGTRANRGARAAAGADVARGVRGAKGGKNVKGTLGGKGGRPNRGGGGGLLSTGRRILRGGAAGGVRNPRGGARAVTNRRGAAARARELQNMLAPQVRGGKRAPAPFTVG